MKYKIEHGVTASLMLDWLKCKQLAAYECDGWRPIAISESAAFGSCWHALLRRIYDKLADASKRPMEVLIDLAGLEAITFGDLWRAEQSRLMASTEGMEAVEDHVAVCQALLPGYIRRWQKDFGRKLKYRLEVPFEVSLNEYKLRGKRDAVFQDAKKNTWILESKTKSRLDEGAIAEVLSYDFQVLWYITATRLEMGVWPRGAIYNIIRRPQIRQKQSETPREFSERLVHDVADRPEFYFVRMELLLPKLEQVAFEKDLLVRLEEFRKWTLGETPTYKNETACVSLWNCPYIHLCASGSYDGYHQRPLFSELKENA